MQQLKPMLKPDKVNQADQVLNRMMMRVVSKTHSGPIPSADELEHLDRVHPGMANRCMEMAEREQAHRHGMEQGIVAHEGSLRRRGQNYAILALALILAASAWLAFLGFGEEAAILGTATIGGVVAVFVTGRWIDSDRHKDSTKTEGPSMDRPRAKTPAKRRAR